MLNEQQLDRYTKITIWLIVIVILLSIGAYFYYYKGPNIGKKTIVEQEIEMLQKRVKKTPRDTNARLYLAKSYMKNKQYSEAAEELKQVIKIDKKNQQVYFTLGLAYKMKGKKSYGLAEKQFNKVVEMGEGKEYAGVNINLKNSYYFMGEISFEKRKYKKALDQLKRSAAIGSTDSDTFLFIGRTYYKLKDYKNAEKYYNEAVRYVPKYAEAYYHLGELYKTQGSNKKAKKNYNKALEYNPKYKEAKEALKSL